MYYSLEQVMFDQYELCLLLVNKDAEYVIHRFPLNTSQTFYWYALGKYSEPDYKRRSNELKMKLCSPILKARASLPEVKK